MTDKLTDLKNTAALRSEDCRAILWAVELFAKSARRIVIKREYSPDEYLRLNALARVFEHHLGRLAQADTDAEQYRQEDDFKRRQQAAHSAVAAALVSGALIKSMHCERCPTVAENTVAHHHDYDKPLDVEWLCRPCHGKHHAEHGPAL
jgi:hypothetical protein